MSEQWSEWIEHKPGDPCPIPWAKQSEWAWSLDSCDRPDTRRASLDAASDKSWSSDDRYQITAYRYRLDCATAGFVPPGAEKPWVPTEPPPTGHGPWLQYRGALPAVKNVSVYMRGGRITAYCVQLEDQPTQDQVEATQKPETPQADATEDAKAANRPMFENDVLGAWHGRWDRFNARQAWQKPTEAPGFMVRDVRSSDGLLTVREVDHRLGDWQ